MSTERTWVGGGGVSEFHSDKLVVEDGGPGGAGVWTEEAGQKNGKV